MATTPPNILADVVPFPSSCRASGAIRASSANETSDKFATATGFWSGDQDANKGVRCVIAYDAKYRTAHQIVFPLGKDGYGRRTQRYFNNPSFVAANGTLMYSDVWSVLNRASDLYRPVPYNLKIVPGMNLWLNHRVENGFLGDITPGPTMSWDINYFNYDFNSFDATTMNYRDACVIKLVKE